MCLTDITSSQVNFAKARPKTNNNVQIRKKERKKLRKKQKETDVRKSYFSVPFVIFKCTVYHIKARTLFPRSTRKKSNFGKITFTIILYSDFSFLTYTILSVIGMMLKILC